MPPLSPLRPWSSKGFSAATSPAHNTFAHDSRERHRLFSEREAAASTDRERLELFAEFIVAESRLRRDRYTDAFESMGSDVLDLTRDLWRSYGIPKQRKTTNPDSVAFGKSAPSPKIPSRAQTQNPLPLGARPMTLVSLR